MYRSFLILLVFAFWTSCRQTQQEVEPVVERRTPFLNLDIASSDSTLLEMTLEEKIGQLIVLKSDLDEDSLREQMLRMAREGKLGGVILEKMKVADYVDTMNKLNKESKTPLLNGTEQAVTLNNQFSDVIQFPLPPSIGSIPNDTLQQQLETLFLEQCKTLGINFAFTPSTNSISLNDKNYLPQVFENENENKFARAKRVLQNLKSENILSIANSFSDFYPIENDTTGLLDSLLAHQFFLAENGISGYLVDEQIILQDSMHLLPPFFLEKYLKEKMNFDGLLVGALTEKTSINELLYAGIDLMIVQDSAAAVYDYILASIQAGLISENVLDGKVQKILMAKQYAGLDQKPYHISAYLANSILKNSNYKYFVRQLFERSITLAHHYKDLLPYTKTYKRNFRIINVGQDKLEVFKTYFSKYANYQVFNHRPKENGSISPLKTVFHKYSTSVVILDNLNLDPTVHDKFIESINKLSKSAKLTVVNYGSALNLQHFDTTLTMVQVFEKNKITESLVPQLLFGGMAAQGSLPISLAPHLMYGNKNITQITRLKYTVPEEVGIAPEKLVGIDAIIQAAIKKRAMPGAQVLVVKEGKVIFNKSFGHHTYDRKQEVKNSDLYDLASITKVAATTLGIMELYEEKKIKIKDRLRDHLSLSEDATVGRITLKQLMTHSSGLQANVPIARFYQNRDSLVDGCNQYFCKSPDESYTIEVSESMYFDPRWLDTLRNTVEHLRLRRRGRFKYSDVNFYLLHRLISEKTDQRMDAFLGNKFYKPLNLRRLGFNPLEKFKAKSIIPTENDKTWREQLLRGHVHDESAALLGGVAGNAGLFANANDLAILFQMLLNGGTYGDMKYLKSATIQKFTSANYGNYRGLGFVVKGRRSANSLSSDASSKTFGHTGFTGTCIWVDPDSELIYVFLSNRIHPKKSNTRLYRSKIRRRVHDVIYDALDSYKVKGELQNGRSVLAGKK
ncbi:MAG: serine hydrolase [Bacteroidota bacterium]